MEPSEEKTPFVPEKHKPYLESLDSTTDKYAIGYFQNEHLKLPGAYWCISALSTIGMLDQDRKEEIVKFISSCQHEIGGFGGNLQHDPHLTSSLYAILVLAQFNALDAINTESLILYVSSLQNEDGSFSGD